jgi:hypothetical protein
VKVGLANKKLKDDVALPYQFPFTPKQSCSTNQYSPTKRKTK